jgi:trehalose 6-phosphate phosphatase
MRTTVAAIKRESSSAVHAAGVPHLLDRWSEISRRVRSAKEIRLFMDFDGTLLPYSPFPDSVKLGDGIKAVLRKIVRHRRIHVGIMSGRRRTTLQRLVRIPHIEFYGLYGWENGNGLAISRLAALHLRDILDAIELSFAKMPGIQAEDKGSSVAIHFRGAPSESLRKARRLIRRVVSNSNGELRVVETDSAWDVVPAYVQGKGAAIRNLLRDVHHDFLPIYIGDDISDEPALAELRHGVTARVGPARHTEARYRLKDSEEVCEFLVRLEKDLP